MSETEREAEGGAKYPSTTEQNEIIRKVLTETITNTSVGRWRAGQFVIAMGCVYGETTLTLTHFGKSHVIDSYVGAHPILWFLDGSLTPKHVIEAFHAELDSRGYGTGV